MSQDTDDFDPLAARPLRERRAANGHKGSVRWMREILGRPLRMERRGRELHVVLQERRRSPEARRAESVRLLCAEIELRVAELGSQAARHAMRHLLAVKGVLQRKGWAAMTALPAAVLSRAAAQARMLGGRDRSARLELFTEHLIRMQVAAEVRADRNQAGAPYALERDPEAVEVSETTHEVWSASDPNWVGSVVPALDEPAEHAAAAKTHQAPG